MGAADARAAQLAQAEAALGLHFRDQRLLDLALRHGSFAHEKAPRVESYERLEFLGDAVLNLVVGEHLFRRHPRYTEGELAKHRAQLVRMAALAHLGRSLGLGEFVLLGRGEEKGGGRHRPALLADAVEAVLGAVFVDSGYQAAHALAGRWIEYLVAELPALARDSKSQLQERLQRGRRIPRYRILREEGPDHAKAFIALVEVDGRVVGEGHGRSKKEAEQAAASRALEWLETDVAEGAEGA